MKNNDYKHLLGKDKIQLIKDFGQEFNYYPANVWTYIIKTGWLGSKYVLIIFFKDNIVSKIKLKTFYGKIKT
ncbi:hypothetical protein QX233_13230 [Chryseobacterium gambrini]|uniref:Uncharacterized protein n=1 Tax=Chryseobacterium gambrini TaxID=373672 RepID=A0AAJ1R8F8_9FLAO|nr:MULTISPECIES: hypothetical protein [Chryseobacterium]MDN4013433.1 hypothetical protein [Chryseobacterium gambrini]QWA37808.1 hypothetical protein KKI44_18095 [Chryseobacterium sp. ZHDP1]